MMNRILILLSLQFLSIISFAQHEKTDFNRQDTIRGSITPGRAWWDLKHYLLEIKADPENQAIEGRNTITYTVLSTDTLMQIDLQPPMKITRVEQSNQVLDYRQDGNAWFIKFPNIQEKGKTLQVKVFYEGKPKVSKNPPWDGCLTWGFDRDSNYFIATSCQGDGASLWWPCKDHMYDEPDSMTICLTIPGNLIGVANGRLRKTTTNNDSTKTFEWFVANPINNYGVNMNIANYVHFSEKYNGEKGQLDCDYYVLPENFEKAKIHFKQVPKMLKAFEYWFGPYPFYEDSYKLVEVPYLGMEHQSSVCYGNQYKNGYLGMDISYTGLGKSFDYIIIHESAHEWFANSITYKDIADMWIHESFACYSEGLYVEYFNNKEAGAKYIRGLRLNIMNDKPIIGKYNVNYEGSGDMYPKGANMLHMIRQLVSNDTKWNEVLRDINKEFYHQVVDTKQVEMFLIKQTDLNLAPVFDQYLRERNIPTLEYTMKGNKLRFRWIGCISSFNMPVKIYINDMETWIKPEANWNSIKLKSRDNQIKVDPDFYIQSKAVSN